MSELIANKWGHFPNYNGEALSWSIGLYFTQPERVAGFPRIKAIVAAMREHRPDELAGAKRELVKASLCEPLFGRNCARIAARS